MHIIANCTHTELKKAARALKDGNLVAFPTETVYGLGADATNKRAVARMYSVKNRPTSHPVIVHVSSFNKLQNWALDVPEYAIKLGRNFWPGPMTLVLKRTNLAGDFLTGGQSNVGVRIPSHPIALRLLTLFEDLGGLGVAAPSANKFGGVSATNVDAVNEEVGLQLNRKDLILDGGQCEGGIESTIIDCTTSNPAVLRPGAITYEMVTNCTGVLISEHSMKKSIRAPGGLEKHYSPNAKVIIGSNAGIDDGLIAMSTVLTPSGAIRLAAPKNIEEFARSFYNALRKADQLGLSKIFVVSPGGEGLATAIRDRINKAAADG